MKNFRKFYQRAKGEEGKTIRIIKNIFPAFSTKIAQSMVKYRLSSERKKGVKKGKDERQRESER